MLERLLFCPFTCPASMGPPLTNTVGTLILAAAIRSPGTFLSQFGHHNQCIELVCHCHGLCGICDQISCDQRIFHTDMSHGDTVTYSDGREHHRCSSCHGNAHLYCLHDLVQVHMSRYDLIIGADNSDQRSVPSLPSVIPSALNRDRCGACCMPFFTASLLMIHSPSLLSFALFEYVLNRYAHTLSADQISHLGRLPTCCMPSDIISPVRYPSLSTCRHCLPPLHLPPHPDQRSNEASWLRKGWLRSDWPYSVRRYPVRNRGSAHTDRILSHSDLHDDSIPMEPVTILASSDKNITKHVLCQDHIKLCRIHHQLHCAVVYHAYGTVSPPGNPSPLLPRPALQSLEESSTFALSTLHHLFLRLHCDIKSLVFAIRRISFSLYVSVSIAVLTPSTSSVFLAPKYSPPVSSLMISISNPAALISSRSGHALPKLIIEIMPVSDWQTGSKPF